jgi:hypothetical protein
MFVGRAARDKGEADKAKLNIAGCLKHVRTETGKSYFAQFREMLALSLGFGKLAPYDYFYYQLYDDRKFSAEAKRRFVSEAVHERIIRKCCDTHWWGMADDKLVAYALLRSFGVRVPETYAVFHPGTRNCGYAPTFRTPDALADFLRREARYPFFAKPIGGIASYGAWLVDHLDSTNDALVLGDGERIAVTAFVREIADGGPDGYVMEELLKPHPLLEEVCGKHVSTVRLVVIIRDAPEILRTVWKIPAGTNIADNFWRRGNLLAAVDVESGTVTRCIQGVGPALSEVEAHPDTGKAIRGLALPHWEKLKRLCLDSAAIYSKLRYQSWDIALCPEGPVVVEVNTGGAFLLPQVATGEGILDERFGGFLRAQGAA